MKRASLTVEAALIIPMCVMIIIVLIYTVFVMHDRAYVYMEIGKIAEESRKCGNTVKCNAQEYEEKAEAALEKRCLNHLFVCNMEGIRVKYGSMNITVNAKLKCSIKMFDDFNIESRYYIADYSNIIRGIKIAEK